MTRRTLIFAPLAAASAQAPADVLDLLRDMAAALSEANAAAFLKPIDPAMKGFAQLAADVTALVAQNEVASSIEFVKDEGDERVRRLELDWLFQIRAREQTGIFERRRNVVECRLERRKNRWIVVSLEPLSFFSPPRP